MGLVVWLGSRDGDDDVGEPQRHGDGGYLELPFRDQVVKVLLSL